MRGSFCGSVSPKNFKVTCMDSARTQRAARHSGFRRWTSVARALRTALGKSKATNRRMALLRLWRQREKDNSGVRRRARLGRRTGECVRGRRESDRRVREGRARRRGRYGRDRRVFPACRRPGPATPVTPTPRVAPVRLRMPSARASATSELTAPFASIKLCGTPTKVVFQLVAVADYAAKKIGGAAGHVGKAFGEHAARCSFRRRRWWRDFR